jgi:hypothetical protein
MSEGNLSIAKDITCRGLSDGKLNIQNGTLTTSGNLVADNIVANRSIDVPAEYYANMYFLNMQQVHFSKSLQWKLVSETTNSTQIYFPGVSELHHGVNIRKNNRIQLERRGKWSYQYTFLVRGQGYCIVGATFDHLNPNMVNGYGQGTNDIIVHGFGILNVLDTEVFYQLYFQHLREPTSGELGLQLQEGNISFNYLGR